MRVLVCKTFGLGNAIMSVPMIKALSSMFNVDVLMGSTADDAGAYDVFSCLRDSRVIDRLYVDFALEYEYDIAVLAIPYDGRWRNGSHFKAKKCIDGRTRPDPSTIGLISWEKHEIDYQIDNAYELGYVGPVPSTSFMIRENLYLHDHNVYVGVGYKKDDVGMWKVKHWGNENFAKLIRMILDHRKEIKVYSTGSIADWSYSLGPIKKLVGDQRFIPKITDFKEAFNCLVDRCCLYVGNDTGMTHVAASENIPSVVPYFMRGSEIKNNTVGDWIDCVDHCATPEEVFEIVKRYI